MALTSRITLTGAPAEDPEDFFGTSLGVIFPDDVMNQHGDADHGLLYQSPHLPRPLHISLADPAGDDDRRLFSHYLWNASLLLAEFVESGTLGLGPEQGGVASPLGPPLSTFSVAGRSVLELGAGTALPSLLAALLGATRVVLTDYPAPAVISNLTANAARNARPELLPPPSSSSAPAAVAPVEVEGHAWGELDTPLAERGRRAFDRVLVCDCLWMPWQHENLLRSVEWFLGDGAEARCWVVAGFHTGREKMSGFFDAERLAGLGLEVESIWERDCDGQERDWVQDRGIEDPVARKRWLVSAVLKRSAP
ncbi:putative nicotinamide n-methyltransferase [Diaporthe ampelina]|uniref:Putative nicotinamide n-methyltransferase n=1 Tax=Diaporthe ampelina TaxID=1214573 RepID=A0A0G2I4C7_9PEZI|nr:putative nicotinamide n-methyltransferase [Diaporthe ampelina]